VLRKTRARLESRTKRWVKHALLRAGVDASTISTERARFDRTPFGVHETLDGRRYPLWSGYRDFLKKSWRLHWWPLRHLFGLPYYYGVPLPAHVQAVLDQTLASRTLPVPLETVMALFQEVHGQHRALFNPDVESRDLTWKRQVYLEPAAEEVEENFAALAHPIDNMLAHLRHFGFRPAGARTLEVGCGAGVSSMFLSSRGAGPCIGVDVDLATGGDRLRDRVVQTLRKRRGRAEVTLEQGHIATYAPAASDFDLIFSISVFEHIDDVAAALRNMHRLLKPGGLMYHSFGLWFGPSGGHGSNSYDFPWGHVRLSRVEIERYLTRHRPHEAASALDLYDHYFNEPRITLTEVEDALVAAGFEILAWKDIQHAPHTALLTADVLADCRREFPKATWRDLLTHDTTFVVRRPV
jgi:SAM-dependent methyltransferase